MAGGCGAVAMARGKEVAAVTTERVQAATKATLIHGLEMAAERKQFQLNIYRDSKLVINQPLNEYEVRKPELMAYYEYARKLIERLG
ncbi:hypothetical protein RJ639_036099 [Escallonia herrerae]|uniref:RNase H type-1 domain-containing protein n=1 Tax=Escallonia herrerae TaxID=1293975 RepID=A0AA88WP59_9ASTE|nr:hypothetical protein RJ639_036099 [Escallonia herrerae]